MTSRSRTSRHTYLGHAGPDWTGHTYGMCPVCPARPATQVGRCRTLSELSGLSGIAISPDP